MSKAKNNLCSVLLKEHFGEVVQKIGTLLMKKGSMPLRLLIIDSKLPLQKVKKALCVLIQHNLVEFKVGSRGFPEYTLLTDNALLLLRYPRYIYNAKTLYGDTGELIIEELLTNGQMTMSAVVGKVTLRLSEATESGVSVNQVKDVFVKLVETQFVQRCSVLQSFDAEKPVAPTMNVYEKEMYLIPEIKLHLIRKSEGSDEPPAKKRRVETQEDKQPDEDIYWRVNFDRFHHYLRDQALITAASRRLGPKAADILRTILRIAETRSDPWAPTTCCVSQQEVFEAVVKETNIVKPEIPPYLSVLTEDSASLLSKVEDRGGGVYTVTTYKALQQLVEAIIMSVVEDRFGSKCCRIFRLLLMKKYLEQKQIEDLAMIPAKDTKEYTYKLFQEKFLNAHEVPRTMDHAPSRTFFLFYVNISQVCRMVVERCYKAAHNAISRQEWETRENKRLLEKQQRVEAIIATLRENSADQTQIDEVEEMITPPERAQLSHTKSVVNKLERSQLQLDETMFILTLFINFRK